MSKLTDRKMRCDCDKNCGVEMWIEENAYLWARQTPDKNGDDKERQIYRFDTIQDLIDFRDILNSCIADRVGL